MAPVAVYAALVIGFIAWSGEGTAVEALNNETDVSPEVRSIFGLLLESLAGVKEYIDERDLGPQHVLVSRRHDLLMINTSEAIYANRIANATDSVIIMTDYDPVEDYVYWSIPSSVVRAQLNGTDVGKHQIIYSGKEMEGLSIDWIARNIYMVDAEKSRIIVSRLDGRFPKTLIDEGIEKPRGIGVDPETGRVFWSEWGSNPRIASAALDGSDVRTIVKDNIGWPNGLAVDSYRKLVYFGDARFDRIEVVGMDGTGRRTITSQGVEHIFGLSYLGGYLYFTDWRSQLAVQMSVNDPSKRTTLLTASRNPFGIKATYLDPIGLQKNPCATDNGGCSHLCFFVGKAVKCGCPDVVASNSSTSTSTAPCFESQMNL